MKVICGDCLALDQHLPAESVDLVLTSPPYAMRRQKTYGGIPAEEYVDWFLPRAAAFWAVLKPTGSFILNIKEHTEDGERSTYVLRLILALKEQGWRWHEEYIWHKPNPMPGRWKTRLKDGWERCLHFTKQADIAFYPNAVRKPMSHWTIDRAQFGRSPGRQNSKTGNGFGMNYEKFEGKIRAQTRRKEGRTEKATKSGFGFDYAKYEQEVLDEGGEPTALPSNVITIPNKLHGVKHSAVFPLELPRFFIKLLTQQEDLVVDPFAGSGTTGLIAKDLRREFLGVEINGEYAEQAQKRIVHELPLM